MKVEFFVLLVGIMASACQAQTRLMETTFVPSSSFTNTVPYFELTLANDGSLYGVAPNGDAFGDGCIFRIDTNGTVATVPFDGVNGGSPLSPPLRASDGSFFGLSTVGGAYNAGTVYHLDTNGVLGAIYSFDMINASGPAAMIIGSDGNFYGVTGHGGIGYTGTSYTGYGVAFQVTTNGVFTRMASFLDPSGFPNSIVEGDDGNFYGTTLQGGVYGYGTVFRMTSNGDLSTLYTFDGTNAAYPQSLIKGSDGVLYGCTTRGGNQFTGASLGNGTVYRITTNGDFTRLWAFSKTDGAQPKCRLLEVTNGLFYGISYVGGRNGQGNVFQISSNGVFASVLEFDTNYSLGGSPWTGLTKGADGNFYGVNSLPAYSVYCLRPAVPPVFRSSVHSGQVSFNWNAWGGLDYELVYKTNLNVGNWQVLAGSNTETNSVGSYAEPLVLPSRRFYTLRINVRENWW